MFVAGFRDKFGIREKPGGRKGISRKKLLKPGKKARKE